MWDNSAAQISDGCKFHIFTLVIIRNFSLEHNLEPLVLPSAFLFYNLVYLFQDMLDFFLSIRLHAWKLLGNWETLTKLLQLNPILKHSRQKTQQILIRQKTQQILIPKSVDKWTNIYILLYIMCQSLD